MTKTPTRCPNCRKTAIIPIAYGMADVSMAESRDRGELILGGCMIDDGSPIWHCTNVACENEWSSLLPAR
jgi:hypothetical protein